MPADLWCCPANPVIVAVFRLKTQKLLLFQFCVSAVRSWREKLVGRCPSLCLAVNSVVHAAPLALRSGPCRGSAE
jgi:hypothetical protein